MRRRNLKSLTSQLFFLDTMLFVAYSNTFHIPLTMCMVMLWNDPKVGLGEILLCQIRFCKLPILTKRLFGKVMLSKQERKKDKKR